MSVEKEKKVTDEGIHFNYATCDGDEQTLADCPSLGGPMCRVYMSTIVKLTCSSNTSECQGRINLHTVNCILKSQHCRKNTKKIT